MSYYTTPTVSENDLKHGGRDQAEGAFEPGLISVCPKCEGRTVFQTGLKQVVGEHRRILVANLRAFVCTRCHAHQWDAPSYDAIIAALSEEGSPLGIRVKVSKLAKNNAGIYLPQDLQHVMGLDPGDHLRLYAISKDMFYAVAERAKQP